MAPRTKQKAMKTPKITRKNYVPPAGHNAPASYPWPHVGKEGQPIDLDDPKLLTFNCIGWDKESAQKYNMLLNTEILPTRFGHTETLAALGLDTDVFETHNAMEIAPLCYQTHELYYDNPQAPTYENCSFTFMADGKFCSLSLDQHNEIYEISDERKDVAVENKFTPTEGFWDLIATGSGSFASRKAYQS